MILDTLSVPMIRDYVKSVVGEGWEHFEVETIVMTLYPHGAEITPLLIDKIYMAKLFTMMPDLFFNELMFFMHACDVFNDHSADFETVPSLNSLELAKGILEGARMLDVTDVNQVPAFSLGIREYVKHVLIDDGYTAVIYPFNVVGVSGLGTNGVYTIDMQNKELAVKQYIHGGPVKENT